MGGGGEQRMSGWGGWKMKAWKLHGGGNNRAEKGGLGPPLAANTLAAPGQSPSTKASSGPFSRPTGGVEGPIQGRLP